MQKREQDTVTALFDELIDAPHCRFPDARGSVTAPTDKGVYVIYDPKRRPLHVGSTPRASHGIAQRLRDHLAGKSSFVEKEFKGHGSALRATHFFSFLAVSDSRTRALLEALAIGRLCPKHIGHGLD
jgi:hypothetical protein